jgi:hypothetical protein
VQNYKNSNTKINVYKYLYLQILILGVELPCTI